MQIFSHFRLNPTGRTDVVGGSHAVRGPQVARDWCSGNAVGSGQQSHHCRDIRHTLVGGIHGCDEIT